MAITFPTTRQAWWPQANWLDYITSFSFSCWVRLDTFVSPTTNQGIWAHNGANYLRFQKAITSDVFTFGVTSGTYKVVSDTITPVQGTVYHVAATWVGNDASGLKFYRDGALTATSNTTGQTTTYNSGGNIDLYINGISNNNRLGYCSIEALTFWTNYVLDADQVAALYWLGWPHLAVPQQPAAFWPMNGELLSRIPDQSGNGRHIETATIDSGITDGGLIGQWGDPVSIGGNAPVLSAPGPPPPASWTLWTNVTHPLHSAVITGLTNGTTYEFSVIAVDESDNESVRSDTVEGTPVASATFKHIPKRRWFGH